MDFAEAHSEDEEESLHDDPGAPQTSQPRNTLIMLCTTSELLSTTSEAFNNVSAAFQHHGNFNCIQLDSRASTATIETYLKRAIQDAQGVEGGGVICMVFCGHGKPAKAGATHGTMILETEHGEEFLTQQRLSRMLGGFMGAFMLVLGACDSGAFQQLAYGTNLTSQQTSPSTHTCKYIAVVACDTGIVASNHVNHMFNAFAHCVKEAVKYKFLESEMWRYWRNNGIKGNAPHVVGDLKLHGRLPGTATDMVRFPHLYYFLCNIAYILTNH